MPEEIDDKMGPEWIKTMMSIGILSFNEQENLWGIAKRCTKTAGLSMGGAGLVAGTAAGGTVTLPIGGLGAIPMGLAGALAGLAGGTISCVVLNVSERDALRKLAKGE